MSGRSQRHMREFTGHYTADAAGNKRPRIVTAITNQATNTTATLGTSTNFSAYPAVTYSATGLPTTKTIHATTGLISGTSSTGSFTNCQVTARNAYGQVTQFFTWTVT